MSSLALRVLVVDDEPSSVRVMSNALRHEKGGVDVTSAASGEEALAALDELDPDAVVSDVRLPGMDGTELTAAIHERDPHLPVVITTSQHDVPTAVRAISSGATDCLAKPLHAETLGSAVTDALRSRALGDDGPRGKRLREALSIGLGSLIGQSEPLKRIYETIHRVAPTRANVLTGGETGTGKGELAATIHALSQRPGRFIPVHCASLSVTLLESELFGHEKGSFTGADRLRPGRFELAQGGTLFLDEVGDIPLETQVKLLHVLQHKSFQRVGGSEPIAVDFRLIAATHRDLREEVLAGRFREDLYYRLNVVGIEMPPLRDRRDDIVLLANRFLHRHAEANGKTCRGFTEDALAKLIEHDWPGNVRELDNVVERAVVMYPGGTVPASHICFDNSDKEEAPRVPGSPMCEIRRHAILRTLEANKGSVAKTAEVLGMSERTIQQRLRTWGLARPRGRPRKHREAS